MHNKHTKRDMGKTEKGQAAVEFAMVIVALFLIIFGIVEFSRLFFAYATMSHGVREGARYGIVHPGQTNQVITLTQSKIFLIGGSATVTVDYPDKKDDGVSPDFCLHECRIVVHAESTFDAWTPLIPEFQMIAQSTMHFE